MKMMQNLIKLEYLALAVLSVYLFSLTGYQWWVFPALILLPDLGMVGYLINSRVGAATYNSTHHLLTAVILFLVGTLIFSPPLQLLGAIVLGHSNLDRLLGYGLKYPDSFQHTHLGMIGPQVDKA